MFEHTCLTCKYRMYDIDSSPCWRCTEGEFENWAPENTISNIEFAHRYVKVIDDFYDIPRWVHKNMINCFTCKNRHGCSYQHGCTLSDEYNINERACRNYKFDSIAAHYYKHNYYHDLFKDAIEEISKNSTTSFKE